MNKSEIMDKMIEIQEKHNNDVSKFHKDPEFIKLAQLLGRTRKKVIHLQTVKEITMINLKEELNEHWKNTKEERKGTHTDKIYKVLKGC